MLIETARKTKGGVVLAGDGRWPRQYGALCKVLCIHNVLLHFGEDHTF
jgi:hypothetical protein